MEDLLYLVHRIPYPPRKGDKLRSYHFLAHLAREYRVHLGTFIDDPADWAHREALEALCASTCFVGLKPMTSRLTSLRAVPAGEAMSLAYFRSARLRRWVAGTLSAHRIRRVLVFSSSMAQYVSPALHREARCVLDYVDVDSEKFTAYGDGQGGPLGWLYRREGRYLLDYERECAHRFDAGTFVTEAELALFERRAPEAAARCCAIRNGVDVDFFSPENAGSTPYEPGGPVAVFTGAMDYKANVDACDWFANEVLPRVQRDRPDARFFVVGANPTPAVRRLAERPGVHVTGTVDDVRPYIAHADVAVAPLQVARGVQNKVLEAMAMQRCIVCTSGAMEGIEDGHGLEDLVAGDAEDFARRVNEVIADPERAAHRAAVAGAFVRERYDWGASARALCGLLEGA